MGEIFLPPTMGVDFFRGPTYRKSEYQWICQWWVVKLVQMKFMNIILFVPNLRSLLYFCIGPPILCPSSRARCVKKSRSSRGWAAEITELLSRNGQPGRTEKSELQRGSQNNRSCGSVIALHMAKLENGHPHAR